MTISRSAHAPAERGTDRLVRFLPLAGAVYAIGSIAGNLTIGDFPDEDTPVGKLTHFYAAHHTTVGRGGLLLGYAAIFLALFGVALWSRIRHSTAAPVVAAGMLVGTAVAALAAVISADQYYNLGSIGAKANIDPAALQAWHIGGAIGGVGGDSFLFLLPVAVAGIAARALPRWLAWSALVLAVLHLTPLGFLAYLLFLVWALVAGIALTLRPGTDAAPSRVARTPEPNMAR